MQRFLRFALVLLAAIGLAACSGTRVAYNNADSVVRWMADDYFGLEGVQEDDFRERLARFHAWHRSEELPLYSALLNRSGDKIADGLDSDGLLWALDSVKARYRHMAVHAAPELAAVLSTLTPAQFERLSRKFADSNAEYAKKHLKGGETEQRKRRNKRNLELMREWFGDLSDAQEALLNAWGERMPLLEALRLQNRQRRQQEFEALLKAYRTPAELEPKLRYWLINWDEGASPEYRRLARIHEEQYIQMLLELDRGLTPSQRNHAVARMQEYAEIFSALAEAGRKPRSGP
jgi:cytochrome c553